MEMVQYKQTVVNYKIPEIEYVQWRVKLYHGRMSRISVVESKYSMGNATMILRDSMQLRERFGFAMVDFNMQSTRMLHQRLASCFYCRTLFFSPQIMEIAEARASLFLRIICYEQRISNEARRLIRNPSINYRRHPLDPVYP